MKKFALISCVSKKLKRRARAKDLYISTLFKLNMRYARQLDVDEIFVLSAKHGLLSLTAEIDPYEVTLNMMGTREVRAWAERVVKQLSERANLHQDHFVILAGNNYRKFLLQHLRHYEIPLEGLSIGKQLARLKELLA